VASYLRDGLYHGRTLQYYAELEKKISALGVQDVNRALATHVAPQRLVVIRAGDFNKKAAPK
jgi:zinc protease